MKLISPTYFSYMTLACSVGIFVSAQVQALSIPDPDYDRNVERSAELLTLLGNVNNKSEALTHFLAKGNELLQQGHKEDLYHMMSNYFSTSSLAVMRSQVETNLVHTRRVRNNMGTAFLPSPESTLGVYVAGFGSFSSYNDIGNSYEYEISEYGGTVGIEYKTASESLVGISFSMGTSSITPEGQPDSDATNMYLDLYRMSRAGNFEFRTSIGGAIHSYDITRNGFYGEVASNGVDGYAVNFSQEISYDIKVNDNMGFQPYIAVDANGSYLASYTEENTNPIYLDVCDQGAWGVDLTVGSRFYFKFHAISTEVPAMVEAHAGAIFGFGDYVYAFETGVFTGKDARWLEFEADGRGTTGADIGVGLFLPFTAHIAMQANANVIMLDGTNVDAQVGLRCSF